MDDSSIHPLLQLEQSVRRFRREAQVVLDRLTKRLTHVNRDALSDWDIRTLENAQARAAQLEGRIVSFTALARKIRKAKRLPESEWGDSFVKYHGEMIDLTIDMWDETEKDFF